MKMPKPLVIRGVSAAEVLGIDCDLPTPWIDDSQIHSASDARRLANWLYEYVDWVEYEKKRRKRTK